MRHVLPCLLAVCASIVTRLDAQERWSVLLEGLAAKDASVRDAAKLELSTLDRGDWVEKTLLASRQASTEVRKRLAQALGANRRLLPDLANALTKPGANKSQVHAILEQHFIAQALPTPQFPDSVSVFPDRLLRHSGTSSYLDLYDRLLVGRMMELPILVEPALAREGAWGSRQIALPEGSWLLSEMLPPLAGQRPRTRPDDPSSKVGKRGVLIGTWSGPQGFAEFFPRNLSIFLGGFGLPDVAARAAINLGCMEVPTLLPWLEELAQGDGELAQLAILARSVAFLRGHEFRKVASFARRLMKSYAKPGKADYLLGSALRLLLARELELGRLPSWFKLPAEAVGDSKPLWQREKFALLFATLNPRHLQAAFEACVTKGAADESVLLALVHSLRRVKAELAEDLRVAITQRLFVPASKESRYRLPMLAACLALLDGRGPSVPLRIPREALENGSFAEGQIWGRALLRRGARGTRTLLRTLASATKLNSFRLGLTAAILGAGPRPKSSSRIQALSRLWAEHEDEFHRTASEAGRVLLDLVSAWLGPRPPVTRDKWPAFYACWQRIHAAAGRLIEKAEPADAGKELALLLGRALGRLLALLPRNPQNRSAATWLADWLAKKDWADLAMAAALVCLPERRSLEYSIPRSGDSRRSVLEAVILRQRLAVLARTRPLELGWSPVDQDDPLLRLQAGH